MTENKKKRNTQIPLEAISGAADQDAKFDVVGISCEKVKNSDKSKDIEVIEATNQVEYESIIPEELRDKNVGIKVYDNQEPKKQVPKDKKQGMGR